MFLLFFMFSTGVAQIHLPLDEEKFVDSLKSNLTKNMRADLKAYSYFLLSDYYSNYYRNLDTLAAKKYLEKGREIDSKSPIADAKYYFYQGHFYIGLNPEKATKSYEIAIEKFSKIKSEEADLFGSEAWFYYSLAQVKKKGHLYMIKVLTEKAIPLAEKHKNYKILGLRYTQLGMLLSDNAEFDKANIYSHKAIAILEENEPNSTEMLYTYLNSVSNFCHQKKIVEAKENLDKAEKLLWRFPKSSLHAFFYFNKALYLTTTQQYDLAFSETEKGIASSKKFGYLRLLRMFYFNKYDLLKKQKKFTEAKVLLHSYLTNNNLKASDRKEIYKEMSLINEILGNSKEALFWSKEYSEISDSLFKSKLTLEINNLEIKFRTSEKEKQIAQLNTEKIHKQSEINKKNQYLLLLALVSLLLLSIGIFAFFYYTNNKKLSEQREINLQQKLKEVQQREELKITKAILSGEEKERERVAQDLHDGLGGMLAGIKMNLSKLMNAPQITRESLEGVSDKIDHILTDLRSVARNIMPKSLVDQDLDTALGELCESYKTHFKIKYQAYEISKNISRKDVLNIYRIVQEILTNAAKHSGAENVLLQCSQTENILNITAEDNGKGFQPDTNNLDSFGLINIENRVKSMNGKMEIITKENIGTTFNIEVYVSS